MAPPWTWREHVAAVLRLPTWLLPLQADFSWCCCCARFPLPPSFIVPWGGGCSALELERRCHRLISFPNERERVVLNVVWGSPAPSWHQASLLQVTKCFTFWSGFSVTSNKMFLSLKTSFLLLPVSRMFPRKPLISWHTALLVTSLVAVQVRPYSESPDLQDDPESGGKEGGSVISWKKRTSRGQFTFSLSLLVTSGAGTRAQTLSEQRRGRVSPPDVAASETSSATPLPGG